MKDLCAKCARPFELGDDRVQLAPDATYHAGCTVECSLCRPIAIWAAGKLAEHLDDAHPMTTFADEPEPEPVHPSFYRAENVLDEPTELHEANVGRFDGSLGSARQRVLDEAGRIISADRNSAYGEPEDNLGRIAALWSVYLQRRVSPRDVAWLMVLLKVAREVHAPHDDNPVDVAGYAAIAGEVSR